MRLAMNYCLSSQAVTPLHFTNLPLTLNFFIATFFLPSKSLLNLWDILLFLSFSLYLQIFFSRSSAEHLKEFFVIVSLVIGDFVVGGVCICGQSNGDSLKLSPNWTELQEAVRFISREFCANIVSFRRSSSIPIVFAKGESGIGLKLFFRFKGNRIDCDIFCSSDRSCGETNGGGNWNASETFLNVPDKLEGEPILKSDGWGDGRILLSLA